MPDITMCVNEKCLKKLECYRFMAKPSTLQAYSAFNTENKKECGYYWELQKTDKK